jgi:predicted lipoprotein with Yx(FWY)xxD motif
MILNQHRRQPASRSARSRRHLARSVVDGSGRTVYVFANDRTHVSTCMGGCATNWPPVPAPAPLPTSVPGLGGALGTTDRSDGSHQLTIAAHPVYRFSGDSSPGQGRRAGDDAPLCPVHARRGRRPPGRAHLPSRSLAPRPRRFRAPGARPGLRPVPNPRSKK